MSIFAGIAIGVVVGVGLTVAFYEKGSKRIKQWRAEVKSRL